MGLTLATPGSATIGTTEYSLPNASTTLTPQTDDCLLSVYVDPINLAAGDLYRLRMYENIDGTNQRTIRDHFIDAPIPQQYDFGVVGAGWDVTLTKVSGTDRSIAWRIDKVT